SSPVTPSPHTRSITRAVPPEGEPMSTATLIPPAPAASTPPAEPTPPAALAPVGPATPASRPPLEESAARQALDLAQQGFLVGEIGELLDVSPVCVEQALEAAVPGGSATIAGALRRRLRSWRREHENSPWWKAEAAFGVPHAHVLRLVRVPRDRDIGVVAAG